MKTNKQAFKEIMTEINNEIDRIVIDSRKEGNLQRPFRESPGPGRRHLPIEKKVIKLRDVLAQLQGI